MNKLDLINELGVHGIYLKELKDSSVCLIQKYVSEDYTNLVLSILKTYLIGVSYMNHRSIFGKDESMVYYKFDSVKK